MRIRYAIRNLGRARGRLLFSFFGTAFAAFLMAVEGSLLYGFTLAASRIVDAVDADIWIVGRGIPAFEYVSPIDERIAWLARGVPGVAMTGRGIAGWAPLTKDDGQRTFVLIVAADREFRGRTPDIAGPMGFLQSTRAALAIDATDRYTLGAHAVPSHVQVSRRRASVVGVVDGFASFLGTPFAFAEFSEAKRLLPYRDGDVSFITVRTAPGYSADAVRDALRTRFPDVDVLTAGEFSNRSRIYWLVQTGAGGALSVAAILGFIIGLSVIAQTIYSLTSENVEEFATMKALGASNGFVRFIVLAQSLICGVVGGLAGLALVQPFTSVARHIVTWIAVPPWMYLMVLGAMIVLCILAALFAARPALGAEPGRVFRA